MTNTLQAVTGSPSVDAACSAREMFFGFRGWKCESGDNVNFLSVVCSGCSDLLKLCEIVKSIDELASVMVRDSIEPWIEIAITLDNRRDVESILALR